MKVNENGDRVLPHPMAFSPHARAIMAALLEYLETVRIKSRKIYDPDRCYRACLNYGQTRDRAHLSVATIRMGTYLGEIARFCIANKLPPINALVVNSKSRTPGGSYLGWGNAWEMDLLAVLTFKYPSDIMRYVSGTEREPAESSAQLKE